MPVSPSPGGSVQGAAQIEDTRLAPAPQSSERLLLSYRILILCLPHNCGTLHLQSSLAITIVFILKTGCFTAMI